MAARIDKMAFCPVTTTIRLIGGKWRPRILWRLREGPQRFSELRRKIPRISEKMLAADLNALEAVTLVSRREFYEKSVLATEYAFTDYGRTLSPALDALGYWGLEHQRRNGRDDLNLPPS